MKYTLCIEEFDRMIPSGIGYKFEGLAKREAWASSAVSANSIAAVAAEAAKNLGRKCVIIRRDKTGTGRLFNSQKRRF